MKFLTGKITQNPRTISEVSLSDLIKAPIPINSSDLLIKIEELDPRFVYILRLAIMPTVRQSFAVSFPSSKESYTFSLEGGDAVDRRYLLTDVRRNGTRCAITITASGSTAVKYILQADELKIASNASRAALTPHSMPKIQAPSSKILPTKSSKLLPSPTKLLKK